MKPGEETLSAGSDRGKYISSVKVGPKGQVVIPKEARAMFGINPGDTLLLLADVNRGIALQRLDSFNHIVDEVFLQASAAPADSAEHADGMRFISAVKAAREYQPKEEPDA